MPKMFVKVQCESCNQNYAFDIPLTTISKTWTSYYDYGNRKQVSGWSSQYAGSQDPEKIARSKIYPCPKCGYFQSWMKQHYFKNKRSKVSMPVLMASFLPLCAGVMLNSWINSLHWRYESVLGYIAFGAPILGIIALFFIEVGALDSLLDPNRHLPKTTTIRKPEYEVR